jgi:muramoyltetrapeptide carboxypeptidase
MDIPVVHPRRLNPGDTIEIIAPAGPVYTRDDLMCGIATLERIGFRIRFSERIFHTDSYLAGPDHERAEELMHALEDPGVHAVISLRGGYGCSRLIPLIDQSRIRRHCKIFMGFSDLTTLHLYFRRRFGWITFHGPMATSPALAKLKPAQEIHLLRLWTDPSYLPSLSFPELETWVPGAAEGELVGGCLSLLAASIGTPYEPVTDGKVLFLEDLGEAPYRIDRMLMQLWLAHKLDNIAGVLLGSFRDCDPEHGTAADDALRTILEKLQVPVLARFPAGHGADNWVLPLGARVRLDATSRKLELLEATVTF